LAFEIVAQHGIGVGGQGVYQGIEAGCGSLKTDEVTFRIPIPMSMISNRVEAFFQRSPERLKVHDVGSRD